MDFVHPSGTTEEKSGPGDGPVADGVFSATDLARLDDTIADARFASMAPASALLAPLAPHGEAAALTERECVFDHCAVLLFPATLAAGLDHLERRGLAPLPTVPSTVVRGRLSERHGLDPADCEVHITRLRLELPDGRRHAAVEVFLFPRDSRAFGRRIEAAESSYGFENHTAFVVERPSAPLLRRLVGAWRTEAGLLWEGGGHNPHEGGAHGSTVTYFVRDHRHPAGRRRFELHCAGDLRDAVAGLPRPAEAVRRAYASWPAAAAGATV
ncbi:hypothetical protein ACFFSH_23200 [Streptomyces filamentosus]|uniref:Uncharacterized protein n=1 Tax=Streptomyces filamentosus TaxID=67294 RepID=A0A919ESX0_STRFL|nr:hypothetical protein [Streptomyces filamentosus]KAA6216534.1 hypothetical protein CP979_05930 [Streptomyces filamentosus]GHG21794.1 hypothetical protein GCM10017667_66740 [Streptomyces filamentosus]